MRKKSRQKAIFSSLADIGLEPSPQGPMAAGVPANAEPEKGRVLPGPRPLEPEPVASQPQKAEVAPAVTSPPPAAREPSPRGPITPTPDLPAKPRPEEIPPPLRRPKLREAERVAAKPSEAEVPQPVTHPDHLAIRPSVPENVAVPVEPLAPPAGAEFPPILIQAAEAEIPLVPPVEPEPVREEPPSPLCSAVKAATGTLDFGRVWVGDFADRTLAVENEGNGPGVLTDLKGLPDAGFSLIDSPRLPCTLNPAGSQLFTVRFSPDSEGRKAARLSVVLDGHNDPAPEVRLTGVAVRTITTPQSMYFSPVFNSLDMSFVYVSPGAFIMGSPETELGRNRDEKQHGVTLSRGFYLQTTPVTQGQWQAVMGAKPTSSPSGGDYPMTKVSWQECQVFIQKLNLLGEGVYRLPTEAEWEYACRAGGAAALGDQELTAFICEYDPVVDAMAWYCGNADGHSHPVALKNPNAWGLYDIHGNVMEWCQDWYGDYPDGAVTDPAGPPASMSKVIRGGSWFSSAKNCRAAFRGKWAPNSRSHYIGLRLLKELE
jgi:formylglycine-generating enzyme required for sulfatase activity